MKRLVEPGVVGDGEEFEGFQGSGGLALLKRPSGAGGGTTARSSSGSHSRSQSQSQSQESRESFGHFVSAPPPAAEEDDEEADLDGGLYARKKSKNGTNSNEGASDSRRNRSSLSRTSASASDQAHHISQSTLLPQPLPKSKQSQCRSRSNASSQSPSLPSPSSPVFSVTHGQAQIVSPSTVEQGQGFFDLENDLTVREEEGFPGRIGGGGFPVARIGTSGGGFPITGFAGKGNGRGGGGKRSRDFGAFLARRGDEEQKGRVAEDGV